MDDLDLSPLIRSILEAWQASRTAPHADAATTAACLARLGYPAHEAVLEFQASYGGLQFFETEPDAPSLKKKTAHSAARATSAATNTSPDLPSPRL